MAKKLGKREKGKGIRGPLVVLALVGFVVLAVGVNLRRVYGYKQEIVIRDMKQKREALISEQQTLQDGIRVASDRSHLIDVAQSRLNMKMPELNQVIDLPHRPLGRAGASGRP
jgi:hypothetical protein